MSKQDYVLKKHVRAYTAAEAIELDTRTPVHEVFLIADKPERLPEAIGFHSIEVDPDL